MDELIFNYTSLLKLAEDMDLKTLEDIKYMGNLKKRRTEKKLSFLNKFPKCELVGKLKDRAIQDNLDLQSRLAYWTFVKIQDTLSCENLKLDNEPYDNLAKLEIYDYFVHLILLDEDKEIKDVLGVDNKILVIDSDSVLHSDSSLFNLVTQCGNNSFVKLVNHILEQLGIDQSVDLKTKQVKNPEGPVIYTDLNYLYFMCDNEKPVNIIVLNPDGTNRVIKVDSLGTYCEIPVNSLMNYEKNKKLSRTK